MIQSFATATIFLGMFVGFVGGLMFIGKQLGFWWALVAFFLAPATIPIAPIYKWIAMGDGKLFMWSYGLGALGVALSFIPSSKK